MTRRPPGVALAHRCPAGLGDGAWDDQGRPPLTGGGCSKVSRLSLGEVGEEA